MQTHTDSEIATSVSVSLYESCTVGSAAPVQRWVHKSHSVPWAPCEPRLKRKNHMTCEHLESGVAVFMGVLSIGH